MPWKVYTVVGSIVVVGVLKYALFHTEWDLKAAQMKVQHSLIHGLMLYEIKPGHNVAEATKNICCVKGEGVVDHSTVTRWFKNFS